MSEPYLSPFPTTHVLDTSLLRTIGGTGRGIDLYQTFIGYIRLKHRDLYLNCDVARELTEQRGHMSVGWVDRVDTTGQIWFVVWSPGCSRRSTETPRCSFRLRVQRSV
ncbi:MAG: hypothetical protein J07HQX50_02663 [Haloquadratum sp. J07HQX50]|nr:MAG: hypothetical protein J07HQX50_02663 [Haloquadratum sp. J07HQX50]